MNREKIRKTIKKTIKKIILQYKRYDLSNTWKEFASNNNHGYQLTKEQKKQFDSIYKKYGNKSYEISAYYASNTGKFDPRYIPDDLYYNYIDRYYNDWDMATIFDHKCFYEKYFPSVKHPDTVVMRINSIWFNKKREVISFEQVLFLLRLESDIFIKIATESEGGHGVFYVSKEDSVNKAIKIIKDIDRDLIIQRPIIQHEKMSALNESSVNSIRVLTLLSNNGVKIYSSLIRIGAKGSKVDNNSSGGISCGIDEGGRLKKYIYSGDGQRIENKQFFNYQIPAYDKILDTVKELACQVPYFRLISWDFTIDQEETPVLIEANFKYGGLDFHQLNNGPMFGKDAPKILKEVFKR